MMRAVDQKLEYQLEWSKSSIHPEHCSHVTCFNSEQVVRSSQRVGHTRTVSLLQTTFSILQTDRVSH